VFQKEINAAIVRPYVLTPGTAKQQVQMLREAFMDTLKDPEAGHHRRREHLKTSSLQARIRQAYAAVAARPM
jgi:hypothetical protein